MEDGEEENRKKKEKINKSGSVVLLFSLFVCPERTFYSVCTKTSQLRTFVFNGALNSQIFGINRTKI